MKRRTKIILYSLAFIFVAAGLSKIVHDGNEYKERERAIDQVRYQLAWSGPDERIREKVPELIDKLKKSGLSYADSAAIVKKAVSIDHKTLELVEAFVGVIALQTMVNNMK